MNTTAPAGTVAAPQLRDIHLPPPVSWWPLAPGWWLMLALLLLAGLAALWLVRKRRRRRYQRVALRQLEALRRQYEDSGDSRLALQQLSRLLRHLAVLHYPADECAGLYGEQWLEFLDRPFGERRPFGRGVGRCLELGPYQPQVAAADVEQLFAVCREWLEHLPVQTDTGGRS